MRLTLALIAVLFAGLWVAHRAGYKAGEAAVEARWAAARDAEGHALVEALHRSREVYEAEIRRRDEVARELEAKLAGSDARADGLSRRLRHALGRSCPLPAPGSPAPVPDGPARESGDEEAVGAALAAHLAACERDATRLAELQTYQ